MTSLNDSMNMPDYYVKKPLYQIDEVGKTILLALKEHGRGKTFSQILNEGRIICSKEAQVEAAIVLEALLLIESVTYLLPLEIRAELTPTGKAIANKLQKASNRKRRALSVQVNTTGASRRRLHLPLQFSMS